MIALYDHIQELRAELRGCMTRRERAAVQAELAAAIAAQAELPMATFTRMRDEVRTQAFVDQEFHARAASSKARVSDALGVRPDDFARGRPRCG